MPKTIIKRSTAKMITMKDYKKIKKFNQAKKSKREISRQTKLDLKTVRKYCSMTDSEFETYRKTLLTREKSYETYKDEILEIFRKNPKSEIYTSSIYDCLLEKHGNLPGSERTLRNYVKFLKDTGEIQKAEFRTYEPVDQAKPGKQMQLDFGEEKIGNGHKEYIFATLLSCSRKRFAATQETPFKTRDVINHLLDAFEYMGGIPEEIVIDQDKTLIVSENYGDILLTKEFLTFQEEQGFKLFVCRKSDPESKGKVENLVKFIKTSFFSARNFNNHNEVTESLNSWLMRTANGKISQSTGRIPSVMAEEEIPFLLPLKDSIFRKDLEKKYETRLADKLSLISVEGCRYSVPIKYARRNVLITKDCDAIIVYDSETKNMIAEHIKAAGGQKLIKNTNHYRKTDGKISEGIDSLKARYVFPEWTVFLEKCYEKYQRYFRDQLKLAERFLPEMKNENFITESVRFCIEMEYYSFKQLHESYCYFDQKTINNIPDILLELKPVLKNVRSKEINDPVAKRSISYYNSFLNVLTHAGGKL